MLTLLNPHVLQTCSTDWLKSLRVRTDYGFKIGESERQIAEIGAADKADMVKVLNATQKARLLKHADDNSGKGLEMNKDK